MADHVFIMNTRQILTGLVSTEPLILKSVSLVGMTIE